MNSELLMLQSAEHKMKLIADTVLCAQTPRTRKKHVVFLLQIASEQIEKLAIRDGEFDPVLQARDFLELAPLDYRELTGEIVSADDPYSQHLESLRQNLPSALNDLVALAAQKEV